MLWDQGPDSQVCNKNFMSGSDGILVDMAQHVLEDRLHTQFLVAHSFCTYFSFSALTMCLYLESSNKPSLGGFRLCLGNLP